MEKKTIDPQSRDYSFDDIEKDERFEAAKKEFFIVIGMYTVHALILIFNLYTFAPNPENYTYVLGLPSWVFFEVVEIIAFIVVAIWVVNNVFVEMDMSPEGGIIYKKKHQSQETEVKMKN